MLNFRKKLIPAIMMSVMVISASITFSYAFSDVKAGAWYYEYVGFMEKNKISAGYPDGTYRPDKTVTGAESLALIMKTLEVSVSSEAIPAGEHWAYHYINEALDQEAIAAGFEPDEPIKRGEVCDIMYAFMDAGSGKLTSSPFADTTSKKITRLYELGIFSGYLEDDSLYFKPNNELTRAELSVIVKKLYDYKEATVDGFTILPVLKAGEAELVKNPSSIEDYEKIFLYMAVNNIYKIDIPYDSAYRGDIKNGVIKEYVMEAFSNVFAEYPEYCCYTNGLQYSGSYGTKNTITLETDSKDMTHDEITRARTIFFKEAEDIIRDLIQKGKITTSTSEKERARVLYEWMAVNLKYDQSLEAESFTGYGASHNKTAVCQGYTALYNALCKMAGVEVQGIAGTATGSQAGAEGHIWTLATFDGVKVHIDTTYGDPVPDRAGYCNFDYFAVSSDFIKKNHTWDKEKYGI